MKSVRKRSAGLVMYRSAREQLEVFLVHPGGPFWAKKDLGAWSIPKGEHDEEEEPLLAAIREFTEETGLTAAGPFHELGSIQQSGGKLVTAWAFEGDCDASAMKSNLCRMEWPAGSGRWIEFPEVDRGCWFTIQEAVQRILKGQAALLEALCEAVEMRDSTGS